jgi:hypothetical protein
MPAIRYTAASTNLVAKSNFARVRLWGGGAAGGGANTTNPTVGAGGGGGGFIEGMVPLVPGRTYVVAVGAATSTSATVGINGNHTRFGVTTLIASGGTSGVINAVTQSGGGAGGMWSFASSSGVFNVVANSGGRGGHVNGTTNSGGGGGCGGYSTAGGSGLSNAVTAGTGAFYNPNTGNGGAGRTTSAVGLAGGTYGGGGGGALRTTADRVGGAGAAGYAIVDWVPPASLMLLGCG